ncbi:MAG: helix-turn-helix domain-containing protein [Bacteroidia bacterium]
MEDTITVKVSDLTELFRQLSEIRSEIKLLKEKEEEVTAFTIQQAADKLNLHYNSVRKLIIKGKLFSKFLDGDSGKTIIPFWSIKAYLKSKENSNQ